ncbi:MAG: EAL domain-containing protein [Synechococcales cyanobacterium RM1_1_8]|nr:EAL domain-containing protein [Synechococcales cyanobacterium RM1_1_8]
MPFFSQTGEILGSFALSHRTSCAPLPYHHQLLRTAAHLASIATEHSRSMAQLQHQANHDVLTGLSNRTVLLNRIRQQFERREPTPFAVLFLDVDHFKLINDSWGHGVGDQLLVAIARRLTHYLDHRALVARLGGDEFAVVLDHSRSPAQVLALAEQLVQVLGGMFAIGDREIFAAASVGIAYSSDRHQDPEAILREADIAMYWAKQHPTGAKVAVFDQTMHEQVLNRLALETGLRQAVRGLERNQRQVRALPGENHNHQLRLYYQPIVELKTRAIIGFEALLRWWHPERGEISPELFIPVAEETGLILPLGSWVLQEAIQQLQQWHGHLGQSSLIMSINVSGRQLFQVDFPDQVQQLLEQTQVPPACIKLEITETVLMGASTAITQRLEALRALGVHLSLDDFGTGYSSLSYLHRFPVNTLKIDRLFVMGLVPEQDQLTRTMVALSHGLGLVAIAEGIETEGQLAQLTAMDCEYGQGFLFSKPVNRVEAEALLWGSGVGD